MSNHWYPFYPGDFARDTAHLTLAEDGAYRRMLDFYYATGTALPADPDALYRICRAVDDSEREAVESVARKFFIYGETDDRLHNKRADAELAKRAEHHERLSNAAKKAMRNRWGSDKQATSQAIKQAIASPQPQPKEEKKKNAAKPTRPADSRFQPFYAYAYKAYEAKHNRKPLWLGKDKNGLKALLAGASASVLPIERLTGLWDSFLASTETFTAKQGDSLSWFCSNLDKFSNGPILEGETNGKLVNFAKQRSEGNARAIESVLGRFEETPSDIRRALPATNK